MTQNNVHPFSLVGEYSVTALRRHFICILAVASQHRIIFVVIPLSTHEMLCILFQLRSVFNEFISQSVYRQNPYAIVPSNICLLKE